RASAFFMLVFLLKYFFEHGEKLTRKKRREGVFRSFGVSTEMLKIALQDWTNVGRMAKFH
ncbi:MAG: hypothetical protein ACI4IT_05955, partial [Oscillospiraceae bacterium]